MRSLSFFVLVATLVSWVPSAAAQTGFYLGGTIGRSSIEAADFYDDDTVAFRFEDDDQSYKLYAGYRILKYLAVEASWVEPGNLQAQEVSTGFGDVGLNANLTMFDALAVGIVPFGGFELFGKLGAVAWDADTDVTIDGETTFESDSGTDAVYGLGIGIRANKFTIRIEGEHFEVGAGDGIRIFSIGFHYTF